MTSQHSTTKRPIVRRSSAAIAVAFLATVFAIPACSLFNQEGPLTTCEELQCGRINACQEGIIAQCSDGAHLEYHVCGSHDVCKDEWQVQGQYKCSSDDTDCEGCRPERVGCSEITGAESSSGTGVPNASSATAAGGGSSAASGG